jgi:hypothetical protein
MTRRSLAFLLAVLTMPAAVSAHRLDELLQASRIGFSRDRVTLEVDLTPGASVAPAVVAALDESGDGAISPAEAHAFGQRVVASLVLELDGRRIPLALTRVEAPPGDEMRAGLGTIALRAEGRLEAVSAGRHDVYFRNDYRPDGSVYLANALAPADRQVAVLRQRRDPRQQSAHIEYEVGSGSAAALWILFGVSSLSAAVAARRSDTIRARVRLAERATPRA